MKYDNNEVYKKLISFTFNCNLVLYFITFFTMLWCHIEGYLTLAAYAIITLMISAVFALEFYMLNKISRIVKMMSMHQSDLEDIKSDDKEKRDYSIPESGENIEFIDENFKNEEYEDKIDKICKEYKRQADKYLKRNRKGVIDHWRGLYK